MNRVSLLDFTVALGNRLQSACGRQIPVTHLFQRDYATIPTFVTFQIRGFNQPVFTGRDQDNIGINTPTVQITLFSKNLDALYPIFEALWSNLHGYAGLLDPAVPNVRLASTNLTMEFESYIDEDRLYQIVIDAEIVLNS